MSRLQGSLAIERASVVHGYSVAASPRWCAAVGLLIMLALSAIAVPAERQWQPGPLESAEPDSQALPTSLGSQAASLAAPRFPSTEPPAAATQRAASAYAKLPLFFVPNAGQTDQSVRYYAQGAGYSFYFTDHKAVLALQKGDRGQALHLRFLGASQNARLEAGDRATGRVNYLTGSEHHTNLPTYGRLIYRDLWPGIDLVFRGEGGTLKYEFHLAPGARVDEIRLAYRGADRLTLARGGDLLVHTPLGPLRDARPRSYQVMDRRRVPVESRYLLGPGVGYGFALGADYDPRRPLVIDPGLVYSTFLGGFSFDDALGIAVDPAGHAYVTGRTHSTNFPTTAGAFDTTLGFIDAFVTKLSRDGSALIYSTYLGGASVDEPSGIAVDPEGRAYVAGSTQSVDFPTTAGAFDTTLDGAEDAFVTTGATESQPPPPARPMSPGSPAPPTSPPPPGPSTPRSAAASMMPSSPSSRPASPR